MRQKRQSKGYFDFSRKERNGTIVLLAIILVLMAIPFVYSYFEKEKVIAREVMIMEPMPSAIEKKDSFKGYARTLQAFADQNGFQKPGNPEGIHEEHAELFFFDPNTLPEAGWKKLGVREKTIATIQHYLSKGGKFRKPEDIRNIWGLGEEKAGMLIPYVSIDEPAATAFIKKEYDQPVFAKKKGIVPIEINEADSISWMGLPGIGTKLSARIISFREKLGGFYSIDQVAETFGLADSVFQRIKPMLRYSPRELKQININDATFDELKQHPYIRGKLAGQIIQFRNQHGPYAVTGDLKKIMTVNDSLYTRLSPYLVIK